MGDVAVLGLGMHPWGKFPEKNLNTICRVAVDSALADAGVAWNEVGAVAAASSRFSGVRAGDSTATTSSRTWAPPACRSTTFLRAARQEPMLQRGPHDGWPAARTTSCW